MGYFRRKLDRQRAGSQASEWTETATGPADWPLVGEEAPAPDPEGYLRFHVEFEHPETRQGCGLFHASVQIQEDLEPAVRVELDGILRQFGRCLVAPDLDEPRAVFFYKAHREEPIRLMWDLAWILREEGLAVHYFWTRRPGRIVYEDEDQVAALPWRT